MVRPAELGWLALGMASLLLLPMSGKFHALILKSSKVEAISPVRFLKSKKSPKDFAEELVGEVDEFNGFNLIVGDVCSMSMVYITNRPKDESTQCVIQEVSPGIHVLSNAKLDTPWPKAQRLRHSFEDVVGKCGEAEISLKEMTEILMKDTRKDDGGLSGIYSHPSLNTC